MKASEQKCSVVVRRRFDRRAVVRVLAFGRRNVERAREIIDHRIDQILHALVLEGAAADDRNEFVRDRLPTNSGLQHFRRDFGSSSDGFRNFVVDVGNLFDEIGISLVDRGFILLRKLAHFVGRPDRVVVEIENRLLVHDVELALEVILFAQRNQNRPGIRGQFLAHRVDRGVEVRSDAVHLVNERDPRDEILVRLTPDGFGLRLHAGDRIENRDRAVEHTKRTLDLGREIHVAGRVDDVDPHFDVLKHLVNAGLRFLRPGAGGGGRRDRDAALALLLHPVGHGRAFVHLTDLVDHAGVKKDALGQRRLAGVNVRGDSDVPRLLERDTCGWANWDSSCHGFF